MANLIDAIMFQLLGAIAIAFFLGVAYLGFRGAVYAVALAANVQARGFNLDALLVSVLCAIGGYALIKWGLNGALEAWDMMKIDFNGYRP